MKLFAEFAVENKLITKEALVDILIEQISTLPSWPEIIHRRKLLPEAALLGALVHQAKHGGDFKMACEASGCWSPELETAVAAELESLRIPIAQILVHRGLIKPEAMVEALAAYFAGAAPPSPLPISGYVELFDESKKASLQKSFASWTESPTAAVLEEGVAQACKIFRALRGAARLAGVARSESMLQQAERTLGNLLARYEELGEGGLRELGFVYQQVVEVLWRLRLALQETGSENDDCDGLLPALMAELQRLESQLHNGGAHAA